MDGKLNTGTFLRNQGDKLQMSAEARKQTNNYNSSGRSRLMSEPCLSLQPKIRVDRLNSTSV